VSAARVRRYRERQRSGKAVVQVEVDVVETEAYLAAVGLLPAEGTDDRGMLEAGLAKLLDLLLIEHRNALQHNQ
jgi:hypothetical protein